MVGRGARRLRVGSRGDRHEVPDRGGGGGRRARSRASGWRPARGELRVVSVVDEEAGGGVGAQWLTAERPDLARCDLLLNEGGGSAMPFGDRRLYGVCFAEKGIFRFTVAPDRRGRARRGARRSATTRCSSSRRCSSGWRPPARPTTSPTGRARCSRRWAMDPDDPAGAVARLRGGRAAPRRAGRADARRSRWPPRASPRSEKINVIPARAELKVDCRVPPGMGRDAAMRRIERGHRRRRLRAGLHEEVVGNALADRHAAHGRRSRRWVGDRDPGARSSPRCSRRSRDSRTFRAAFPDCVAYGFFPQRHQIPVRDLADDARRRRADRRPRPRLRGRLLRRPAQEAAR